MIYKFSGFQTYVGRTYKVTVDELGHEGTASCILDFCSSIETSRHVCTPDRMMEGK
jgi:hypothetical protein